MSCWVFKCAVQDFRVLKWKLFGSHGRCCVRSCCTMCGAHATVGCLKIGNCPLLQLRSRSFCRLLRAICDVWSDFGRRTKTRLKLSSGFGSSCWCSSHTPVSIKNTPNFSSNGLRRFPDVGTMFHGDSVIRFKVSSLEGFRLSKMFIGFQVLSEGHWGLR